MGWIERQARATRRHVRFLKRLIVGEIVVIVLLLAFSVVLIRSHAWSSLLILVIPYATCAFALVRDVRSLPYWEASIAWDHEPCRHCERSRVQCLDQQDSVLCCPACTHTETPPPEPIPAPSARLLSRFGLR